jgi:CsoR family transcriptional regulator, copper-sensing transcriptional repressor
MAYRPKDTQERILHRLKITKGHLNKIIQMVESDVYCIDIIHQMQAVEKAISQTEGIVLENHLKGCTTDAIRAGKQEEAIKEIMAIFKKSKL